MKQNVTNDKMFFDNLIHVEMCKVCECSEWGMDGGFNVNDVTRETWLNIEENSKPENRDLKESKWKNIWVSIYILL